MRDLEFLTQVDVPAWPHVRDMLAASANQVEVLPTEKALADQALWRMQVTLRSAMGAVVYETGGILVDHGWLRILGSGSHRMRRSLPAWNESKTLQTGQPPPYLLVADDVLGGFFALNGGAFPGEPGAIWYFAPDRLAWENLGLGYGQFLEWSLTDRVGLFYREYRWPQWQAEVGLVSGDEGILVQPFLSAQGPSIGERRRDRVPVEELYLLYLGADE